ncbi:MAG: hypothetical protein L6Q57_02665 [Alphaproteobacteria bacterium]|nr:hypothetical protein [Alphaproteobacteria bacterium]
MVFEFIRNGLLQNNVGNNMINKERDVKKVKEIMSRLGRFDNAKSPEPHGIITRELDQSIKTFQKENNLKIDGIMHPKGETETALIDTMLYKTVRNGLNFSDLEEEDEEESLPPVPPQKPEPPSDITPEEEDPKESPDIPQDEPKHDCSHLQTALDNAEAALQQKEEALEQASTQIEAKRTQLESKISELEQELDAMKAAKTPTDIAVTTIGIASGALGGGLIGSIGGPGGAAVGILTGGHRGMDIADEAREEVSKNIMLKEIEIEQLQSQLDQLDGALEAFENEVSAAESLVSEVEIALEQCELSE